MTLRSGSDNEQHRAQSETLGFVLLLGMVIVTAGVIVSFGAAAVNSSEDSLSSDRAEKVMTQMDSEISMVALGRTNSQDIDFDRVSGEQFYIDEDAGQIDIEMINETDRSTETIMDDVTLGAVKFDREDTTIAYQGGGVWRQDGDGSGMVSPPEFNYRDQTLTLPLVTVEGADRLNNGAVVEKAGPDTKYFPTDDLTNPLEDDIVQVTVQTEYHHGWNRYFETRTEGEVEHEPENELVRVNLTAPAIEEFDKGAATTGSDGPSTQGSSSIENKDSNTNAPSVSSDIEERIDDCNTGCENIGDSDTDFDGGNTYFSGSDWDPDDTLDFDTRDGDIDVIVDGEITNNNNLEIEGENQVTIYANDSVDLAQADDINADGDPNNLLVKVHTEADEVDTGSTGGGNTRFSGYIYAPGSDFDVRGNTEFDGGIVAEDIHVQGNSHITHESADFALEIDGGVNALTFLHISTNPVTVSER